MGRIGKVAIIGGGLSGLAAAYVCKRNDVDFTVFEPVHHMGGNMRTVRGLDVGMGDGRTRWVDLGVNDFSRTGYVELVKVMDSLGVRYRPLQDLASYSSIAREGLPPSEVETGYTIEKGWNTEASPHIEQGFADFRAYCEAHLQELMYSDDPAFKYMTVSAFLEVSGIGKNTDFVNLCLFPRIVGMYFTSRIPPGELPFRVILHYYYLQEGLGRKPQPDPERMYWVDGVRSWVDALCTFLDPGYDGNTATDVLRVNTSARFRVDPAGGIVVTSWQTGDDSHTHSEHFDAVVVARQAWDVMAAFEDPTQAAPGLSATLTQFGHSNDQVFVHTATDVLPPNVNAWSTYNLNLPRSYAPEDLGYSMTYWCNRHQNDPDNPAFNWEDAQFRAQSYLPNFFCTLNPLVPLPDRSIILPPWKNADGGACTMFRFKHNIMTMAAYQAQERLPALQGHAGVWLVGGYTTGVGLQEECWIGAVDTAEVMLGIKPAFTSKYRHDLAGKARVPDYIRRLVHGDVS
ncbi:MAG: NAD(P)-binding protein [Rhodocyclaceae bacterium]